MSVSDRFSRIINGFNAQADSSLRNRLKTFFLRYRSIILRKKNVRRSMARLHKHLALFAASRKRFRIYKNKRNKITKYNFFSSRVLKRPISFNLFRRNKSFRAAMPSSTFISTKLRSVIFSVRRFLRSQRIHRFVLRRKMVRRLRIAFYRGQSKCYYRRNSKDVARLAPLIKLIVPRFRKWYRYYRTLVEHRPIFRRIARRQDMSSIITGQKISSDMCIPNIRLFTHFRTDRLDSLRNMILSRDNLNIKIDRGICMTLRALLVRSMPRPRHRTLNLKFNKAHLEMESDISDSYDFLIGLFGQINSDIGNVQSYLASRRGMST